MRVSSKKSFTLLEVLRRDGGGVVYQHFSLVELCSANLHLVNSPLRNWSPGHRYHPRRRVRGGKQNASCRRQTPWARVKPTRSRNKKTLCRLVGGRSTNERELRRSKASGSKSNCYWVSQPPLDVIVNQSLEEIGNLCVWRQGVVRIFFISSTPSAYSTARSRKRANLTTV